MVTTKRHMQPADFEEAAKVLEVYETTVDACIRVIYTSQQASNWRLCIGQCFLGNDADGDKRQDYPGFIFVSKAFKSITLKQMLDSLASVEGLRIAPDLPPIRLPATASPNWREEIVPSHITEAGAPARRFTANIESNPVFPEGHLIAFDQPFHPSAEGYAKTFLQLNPHDELPRGEFSIEVPDRRGSIHFKDGRIAISDATVPLRLVGEVNGKAISLAIGGDAMIDDKTITDLELWLVTERHAVIDYISTTHWPYKYSATPKEASEDVLFALIRTGESERCEFKPWIDLSNQKAGDIEKTVCAFSNHKGGTLLIGVTKEAEIVGIAREIANRPDNLDKAIADYEKAIRKRLNETLKNCMCFETRPAIVAGQMLIVVEVEPLPEVNYLVGTNIAYIRHGATSAKMSPPEIQAKAGRPSWSLAD